MPLRGSTVYWQSEAMNVKSILIGFVLLASASIGSAGAIGVFDIQAGATFLQQSANDNCSFVAASAQCHTAGFFTPAMVDLYSFGVHAGDTLSITFAGGSMCYHAGVCLAPSIGGIFSSTSNLLDSSNANRLPDAVSAGLGSVQTSTWFALTSNATPGVNNTNPNDFSIPLVGTLNVTVPGQYLFLGILDSFYADNSGNLSIALSFTSNAVATPEPATYLLMLGGVVALAAGRKLFA